MRRTCAVHVAVVEDTMQNEGRSQRRVDEHVVERMRAARTDCSGMMRNRVVEAGLSAIGWTLKALQGMLVLQDVEVARPAKRG